MTTTKSGGGLQPTRQIGGSPFSGATNKYRVINNYSGNLFRGDAVAYNVTTRTLTQVSGTGAAEPNFAKGVFIGAEWVDPTTRQPQFRSFLPAGTSSLTGTPQAYVADDGRTTFVIQADATISVGDIGLNFEVTLAQGNSFTQRSGFLLRAASRTAGAALLRLTGLNETPDNGFETGASGGDPFPYVEVQFLQTEDARTSAS